MTKSVRVLIISNLSLVRAGLRMLIDSQSDFTVIGEATSDATALNFNGDEYPDIVLLDADPESERALELLAVLLAASTAMRVIILTVTSDGDFQRRAIQLGACGAVSKDKAPEILFKAIEKVNAGEVWFDRVMMANALSEMSRMNGAKETDVEAARIATLSKREREVVVLIGEGLKNKQIADRLFISETTVQHHLSSIFGKLGVTDRLELVIYAYRQELVKLPSKFNKKG